MGHWWLSEKDCDHLQKTKKGGPVTVSTLYWHVRSRLSSKREQAEKPVTIIKRRKKVNKKKRKKQNQKGTVTSLSWEDRDWSSQRLRLLKDTGPRKESAEGKSTPAAYLNNTLSQGAAEPYEAEHRTTRSCKVNNAVVTKWDRLIWVPTSPVTSVDSLCWLFGTWSRGPRRVMPLWCG